MVLRRFFSDDKWSTRRWSSCCRRAVDGSARCWLTWLADWKTSHSLTTVLQQLTHDGICSHCHGLGHNHLKTATMSEAHVATFICTNAEKTIQTGRHTT